MTLPPSSPKVSPDLLSLPWASALAGADGSAVGAELPEQILASSVDCIKILGLDGRVLWLNPAGRDLLEICDIGQVIGASWESFWEEPQRPFIAGALADARAGGVGRFEGPCATAQGTPKWWDVAVTSLRDGDGRPTRFLVVSRDITAIMTLSHQRDELLTRERHARLEAEAAIRARNDAFLVVAHELRAPLNAVRGWAALLQFDGTHGEQARGTAAIAHNAERMTALVDALRDAARGTGTLTAEPVPNPVSEILQSAIDTVSPAARAREILLSGGPFVAALIMADFDAAHRAVGNLLFNAIKFTPVGGSVEVRCARAGADVRIEVIDTGIGIAPDFVPRLFEPFAQAADREDGDGLGLGLSIVRGFVEAHGGTVEAFSGGPGQGATFSITLPVLP